MTHSILSTLRLCGLALLLAGCASPQNNYDPIEPVNRGIFSFNRAVDRTVVRPVAQTYADYTPGPIKDGTSNFFSNVDDLFGSVAALFQGKFGEAGTSAGRVIVNTTFGMFGLFDWGTRMGLDKGKADFGQTLGHWGIGSGPYLMVPFYGPMTLRDSADPLVRLSWGPIDYIDPLWGQIAYYGVYLVDARSKLLPLDAMLDSQIDPYAYLRDAYLQARWNKVYDGLPPHPLPLGEPDDDDDVPANSNASGVASEAATATMVSGDAAASAPVPASTPASVPASAPDAATP
ncbi:VacJ family lipoprotein [Jeongeupia naejangsanensis]|uniref:VacJ family lipoprotein n=1 Tax=Jeongeupia naejangsanensis TaxID=613195 RepID=A0ABS2BKJ2_9NEIS|nr:VacJ family lipoprotein [Jeongeupia naejangsanensis]MBM3115945.1 VacJ family lipoprotein [Jeongeupia naejangsanensis]